MIDVNLDSTVVDALKSISTLLDAMETCHICKGTLFVNDSPSHCEDCSGDCDDHEEPNCTPILILYVNARMALTKLQSKFGLAQEGS